MSRYTRPVMQLDSQANPLPSSGDWTTMRAEYYAGTSNMKYCGFAKPGSGEGVLVWQIIYMTYDASNNLTALYYPTINGAVSSDFSFSWSNRAAYTYA